MTEPINDKAVSAEEVLSCLDEVVNHLVAARRLLIELNSDKHQEDCQTLDLLLFQIARGIANELGTIPPEFEGN